MAKNFLLHMPDKFAERGRKQPCTISRANVFYSDLAYRPWVSKEGQPPGLIQYYSIYA